MVQSLEIQATGELEVTAPRIAGCRGHISKIGGVCIGLNPAEGYLVSNVGAIRCEHELHALGLEVETPPDAHVQVGNARTP